MALFEPPSNLPIGKEPEDIFAGQGGTPRPPANAPGAPRPTGLPPRPSAPGVPPAAVRPLPTANLSGLPPYPRTPDTTASIAETPARGLGRKVGRLVIFAIVAAAVVTAGFLGYRYFIAPSLNPAPATNSGLNLNAPITPEPTTPPPAPTPEPEVNGNVNVTPPPAAPTDSDGDGLSDAEETDTYQTNPQLADTDNDGLSDREEVVTWKTDPRNPDTDGDSYEDGAEVKGGYDPKGSGKLLPPISGGLIVQ